MHAPRFLDQEGTFYLKKPENTSYLYFPMASEAGLKSSISPSFGGDAKCDQETFLLEPVSSENLHNNRSSRNFWLVTDDGRIFSATGCSAGQEAEKFTDHQDDSSLTAGFMWQSVTRKASAGHLLAEVTAFVPQKDKVEIMHICVENTSGQPMTLTAYGAVPVYGRSADNIRDHRNVTSMLHRIVTTDSGIRVRPTMSFDEKGHRVNDKTYYIYGCTGDGKSPVAFYPTVESFIGEGGSFLHPRAVYESHEGFPASSACEGREAMGAFRFPKICLDPGEKTDYILLLGVETSEEAIEEVFEKYNRTGKVQTALSDLKAYWREQVNVSFHTGSKDFDGLMKWICFQPFLRRLFGCSFLPHHDYGRGGRGWRDLWQDCLSLLLMNPDSVGHMIEKNFGGVRIDGTNATIIGEGDGNFIADRNGISRVWMDHALWPQMTTLLYLDQTGDFTLLDKKVPYFKDSMTKRGYDADSLWAPGQGNLLSDAEGDTYYGTILEHLLVQQLTAFYDVGDHKIYRLRGADWNDALDMASEKGESVAFTCAYAGNLLTLADLLRTYEQKTGKTEVEVFAELKGLLETDSAVFEDVNAGHALLFRYLEACAHQISGRTISISVDVLIADLRAKAGWLIAHLREQEWITLDGKEGWFNSYYDNHGQAVEGRFCGNVRMMLTGQVFAIMSGVATDEQVKQITESADHYLYKKEIGGYRLNTDFHELKFDMGRMFGFAYGEKENGAVFSHMSVMYANALYKRGFAKEGHKSLQALADVAMDFETSRIYPGIPEYFRADGRGMYHYLTGAASWYMMTMITEVFGVRGKAGDLMICPKLLASQFDEKGMATIACAFAGKNLVVTFENRTGKDFGEYRIVSAHAGKTSLTICDGTYALLERQALLALKDHTVAITVVLE